MSHDYPLKPTCLWCDHHFSPGTRGLPKRFCSVAHRHLFHSAARKWVIRAIEQNFLNVEDLRAVVRAKAKES